MQTSVVVVDTAGVTPAADPGLRTLTVTRRRRGDTEATVVIVGVAIPLKRKRTERTGLRIGMRRRERNIRGATALTLEIDETKRNGMKNGIYDEIMEREGSEKSGFEMWMSSTRSSMHED